MSWDFYIYGSDEPLPGFEVLERLTGDSFEETFESFGLVAIVTWRSRELNFYTAQAQSKFESVESTGLSFICDRQALLECLTVLQNEATQDEERARDTNFLSTTI